MKRRWPWLLAWGTLTVLVVGAFGGVAWDEALLAFRDADARWLAVAVAANLAILPLAAWEWLWLLPRAATVGFRTMFWIMSVTATVSNGGPFLAGHAAGIHLLATRGGMGHATGVSVKALDQLAEGVAKLALVAGVVLVAPLPPSLRTTALVLSLGVPLLGLVLLVAARRAHILDRWSRGSRGWVRGVATFLAEVARQLETMRRPTALGMGILLAVAKKVAEGVAIVAVLTALGIQLPFWGVLLSLTAVNLSTMASVTPANLGVYEASALVAYRLAGLPTEVALGVAVLQHVAYLLPMAGVGWLVLAVSGMRPREVVGEPLVREVAGDDAQAGAQRAQ